MNTVELHIFVLSVFIFTVNGQCPYNDTMFQIPNAAPPNRNELRVISTNQATGSVIISCLAGFDLDPNIGGRITCQSNGAWTPFPICRSNDRCLLEPIMAFVQSTSTAAAMSFNGAVYLPTDGRNNNTVLVGAFVPMRCRDGFVHTGGPLNITCVAGSWTRFPECIRSNDNNTIGITQTPPILINTPPNTAGRCPYNSTVLEIENGFFNNTSSLLLYPDTSTATGSVTIGCRTGFDPDPAIGITFTCSNGIWSTKPRCIRAPRCLLSTITTLASNPLIMRITSEQNLTQIPGENDQVLLGSFAVFVCAPGYTNIGGPLTVRCIGNNLWTQTPNCILNSSPTQTTTSPGISGTTCSFTTSMLSIPNMLSINTTNLILVSANQATAGSFIDYTCLPSFTLVGNSRVICTNGAFSPMPQCMASNPVITPATTVTTPSGSATCLYSSLMLSIPNMMSVNWTNLLLERSNQALPGSYIDYVCLPSFTLVGSSRVICANGAFSRLPYCSPGVGVGTTVPSITGTRCSGMPSVSNGVIINSTLINFGNQQYQGQALFNCSMGYVPIGPLSIEWTFCNSGVWQPLPICVESPTCPFTQLQSSITNLVMRSSYLIAGRDGVLAGGWIDFQCRPGTNLSPTSSSLMVRCTMSGTWTSFPTCM